MRAACVEGVDDARVHVDAEHAVTGADQLHRERQSDVAETDDAKDRGPVLPLREQGLDHRGGCGSRRHGVSGAPARAKEREAASSTRTTRTPSSALARGASRPWAARTKCASSAASGSTAGIRGMKISPSRMARLSPNERYSGGRSTPLS